MHHPDRQEPDRLASLHHRLEVVEERLRVLEHDLHETLEQRPRVGQVSHPRRVGGMSGRPSPFARSRTRSPRVPARGSAAFIDDLVLEVTA